MTTNTHPESVSAITAMNARYEQSFLDYVAAEKAENEHKDDEGAVRILRRAQKELCREQTAMQQAILWQKPSNPTDALAILSHAVAALENFSGLNETEQSALVAGLDATLDFFSQSFGDDSHPEGAIFAQILRYSRERRTATIGIVEA